MMKPYYVSLLYTERGMLRAVAGDMNDTPNGLDCGDFTRVYKADVVDDEKVAIRAAHNAEVVVLEERVFALPVAVEPAAVGFARIEYGAV